MFVMGTIYTHKENSGGIMQTILSWLILNHRGPLSFYYTRLDFIEMCNNENSTVA